MPFSIRTRTVMALFALAGCAAALVFPGGAVTAPIDVSALGQAADAPQVATDAAGNTHVIWVHVTGPSDVVKYVRIAADGTVGAVRDMSGAGRVAVEPKISVNANGVANLAWSRSNGTHDIVQHVRIAADGTVGITNDLSAPGSHGVNVELADDADGNTHVVWRRFEGGSDIVQYRRIAADGTVGAVSNLSDAAQSADQPQLATDAAGRTHVTWERSNGFNTIVQYVRIEANGSIGVPSNVSAPGRNALEPQIATNAAGVTQLTWNRHNGFHFIVQHARIASDGTIGPITSLSALTQHGIEPQIASDAAGNAHVTWFRSNGTKTVVQYVRIAADGAVGPILDLSAPAADAQGPQISADSGGNAHLVWIADNGSEWIVQGMRISAGGLLGPVSSLSGAGAQANQQQIAADAVGNSHRVWRRWNGATYVVQLERTYVPATCADRSVSVVAGASISVPLSCTNRVDSRAIGTAPARGALGAIDQAAATIVYTASRGAGGVDSFTFTANNPGGASTPATITITVNAPKCAPTRTVGCATADRLVGSRFGDRMFGRGGADTIFGRAGNDWLYGGDGADRLFGEAGNDHLFGGTGFNRLSGGAGNDVLVLGRNRGIMRGGAGRDRLIGSNEADIIIADSGPDVVRALGGNDVINSRDGSRDVIDCGPGIDRVRADRFDVRIGCERSW